MSRPRYYLMRITLTILIVLFLLLNGCTESNNQNNSSTGSTKEQLEKMTPAQVLNLYIESIKKGDNETINLLLSRNFLSNDTIDGKGYPNFSPQKISNVKIKVDENKTNNNLEANYNLEFDVEESTEPRIYIKGKFYFFVKLIFEDNSWKIDAFATSP